MNLLILDSTANEKNYEHIFKAIKTLEHNLIGFLSLDNKRIFETVEGYTIFPLSYINILKYDFAVLNFDFNTAENIIPELAKLNIPTHNIKTLHWLLQQIMIKKYEDFQDPVIQETLNYWNNHELTVFNQHTENYEHTFDEMFLDESCGLPFIMFETVEGKKRRMYFPTSGGPQKRVRTPEGKIFIKDILSEQVPTSPHLYIKGEHKINDGDILIDAGVCEGNFALRYVDICQKVYLFEPDKLWVEPLFNSFKDCWDKVEFIPQFVSDSNGGAVTLDEIVNVPNGSKIFLKMDIEGAEPAALHGAKKILSNNKVRASLCSYHNSDDAIKIKSVFKNYGYKTSTSNGYMVFVHDKNIWDTADFRKGIVYADNY